MSRRLPPHVRRWLGRLQRDAAGRPRPSTVAGALFLVDGILRAGPGASLDDDAWITPHRTQLRGISGRAVDGILRARGEHRPFLREGGRTSPGATRDVAGLLSALRRDLGDERLSPAGLAPLRALADGLFHEAAKHLDERGRTDVGRRRWRFTYRVSLSMEANLAALWEQARECEPAAAVARHLVGAKLQHRFPDLEISNDSLTTQDSQLGRAGDFLVGDTVFHVTLAPGAPLMGKCAANLQANLWPCVIVPEAARAGALSLVQNDPALVGRVTVFELIGWLAVNLGELGIFDAARTRKEAAHLLGIYNARVNAVEWDKSLLIEIPPALTR